MAAITQPLPESSSVVDEDTFFPLRKASRRPNEHYSPYETLARPRAHVCTSLTPCFSTCRRLELESFAASLWGVANNDYGRKLMNVRKVRACMGHARIIVMAHMDEILSVFYQSTLSLSLSLSLSLAFSFSQYPFYPQLIYSLLRGRLVVVLGLPRNEEYVPSLGDDHHDAHNGGDGSFVKQIVSALTIFVAGYWRTPLICPWRTAPLRMADLGNLKLLGLAKHGTTHPIPKSVERYVTILDLEQEVLRAPQFRGGNFVLSIVAPRAQWPVRALLPKRYSACLLIVLACASIDHTGRRYVPGIRSLQAL